MNYLTVTYPQSASLQFVGQMYKYTQQVYLSSANVSFPDLSFIDAFSTNAAVSAFFPAFSGYQLPASYYYKNDDNHLYVTIPSFDTSGNYDVILFNVAGYSKLSQQGILIKNTGLNTLNAIETISGGFIVTIQNLATEITLI